MTTIEMMVGIPCSAKSTYCRVHSGVWISSDEIRRELYGDASIQEKPEKVFHLMWRRLCEAVERDEQTIFYDATNVVAKRRVAFCDQLRAKTRRAPFARGSNLEVCQNLADALLLGRLG